jgi:hypothetical protein
MIGLSAMHDRASTDPFAGRRRGAGIWVLVFVAFASGLAGAGIARLAMIRHLGPLSAFVFGPARSPADAHRIAGHLAGELDLTHDQQQQVESILTHRLAEVGVVRDQVTTQLLAMIDSTQQELDGVLTPPQRAKFLQIRRRKGLVDSAGHPILQTVRP